jgi:hypothetical protein
MVTVPFACDDVSLFFMMCNVFWIKHIRSCSHHGDDPEHKRPDLKHQAGSLKIRLENSFNPEVSLNCTL